MKFAWSDATKMTAHAISSGRPRRCNGTSRAACAIIAGVFHTSSTPSVSTGPGAEYYVMPDLFGREMSNARHQLETFGLRVMTPPAAHSVGPIGYQQPVAGSRITRDGTVVLQAPGRVLR